MDPLRYKVNVFLNGQWVGAAFVYRGEVVETIGIVPGVVQSDIIMTYYREGVLFGRDGYGYRWKDVW